MRRKTTRHPMFEVGRGGGQDTMENSYGGIYQETINAIVKQFPELNMRRTYPEMVIRLILSGIIPNQGHIYVGPKLREEFGVNEYGNKLDTCGLSNG